MFSGVRWLGLAALGSTIGLAAGCDSQFSFSEQPLVSGATLQANCADYCAARNLRCVPGQTAQDSWCAECLDDSDCGGDDPRCATDLHRCVECMSDGDCREGHCDSESHSCAAECEVETENAPTAQCSGGCGSNSVCKQCNDDSQCAGALPHCIPGGVRCGECSDVNDTCTGGLHCDPVYYTCVECRDSKDCPDDELCNPLSHLCHL